MLKIKIKLIKKMLALIYHNEKGSVCGILRRFPEPEKEEKPETTGQELLLAGWRTIIKVSKVKQKVRFG